MTEQPVANAASLCTDETARLRVRVVEKRNSLSFLDAVFDAYETDEAIALVDDADAAPDLPGAEIVATRSTGEGGGWFRRRQTPRVSDLPGQITFTSGTTGRPKPVVLSHRALADVVSRLIAVTGADATIREYVGAPVYFSFGLARARLVAAVGGEAFIPERGFDPMALARMLRDGEVNAFSAVPTLIRVVLENASLFRPVGGDGEMDRDRQPVYEPGRKGSPEGALSKRLDRAALRPDGSVAIDLP